MTAKLKKLHSYKYLSGLEVPRVVRLSEAIELQPASGVTHDLALELSECLEDAAVYLIFLPRISSEFKVEANTQKNLAISVWNAGWDVLLLGALFGCEVGSSVQGSCPASEIKTGTWLRATDHHFHGWRCQPHRLTEHDCDWLEANFFHARELLNTEAFEAAVHCLASHYWHPHPRPRLALLWAGIESLFAIDSELSFRLSLLCAKFLEPNDRPAAKAVFKSVKDLYKARSKAVHGGEIKGDTTTLIAESALLLHKLLRRCIECRALPDIETLAL